MKMRKLSRKLILVGLALCLLVSVLAFGCGEAKPKVTGGGILRIGFGDDAYGLGYPPGTMGTYCRLYASSAVESLLCFDEALAPAPQLATDWEVDADAKTITFTLREGVKFHDGTDFNAEVAKWCLDNYKAAAMRALTDMESVDVIDDYTIQINLAKWNNTFLADLVGVCSMMISPTAYEANGKDWAITHPVGTGPFKFVSWERDVLIKFERFDDYWQKGKPYLDGVEWVVIKDPMVLSASFQAGEVDAILPVDPKTAKDLEAIGEYTINVSKGGGLSGMVSDSAHPDSIFADVRLRRAVEYAIDKQAIVDAIFYGMYEVANQVSDSQSWGYNPDVVGYPYNPDKARQLMAEAGYPDGFKTTLYCRNVPQWNVDGLTAVQGYLRAVGIDAELELCDPGKFVTLVTGGWEDGLLLVAVSRASGDDARTLNTFFAPDSTAWGYNIVQPADYVDTISRAISVPDFETKKALVHEAQKLFVDKYALATFIWSSTGIGATYPYVHDAELYEVSTAQWAPADAWVEK